MLVFVYWWSPESLCICKCDKGAIRERIGRIATEKELQIAFLASQALAGSKINIVGDNHSTYIYAGF